MGFIGYYLVFVVIFFFGIPLARRLIDLSRGGAAEASGDILYPEGLETAKERFLAWALSRLDLVFGLLGGLTVARWVGVPGPDDWGTDGPAGVVLMFISGIALCIVAGFVCYLLYKVRLWKGALIAYGSVTALFVFGFLLPINEQRTAKAEAREERAAVIKEFELRMDRARTKWAGDVRTAGAWGALGTEPPMLKVVDDGESVTVTNVIDIDIPCIRMARIYRDPRPGGGYVRCEMKRDRDNAACRTLAPGLSQTYALRSVAGDECLDGELEYRIGEYTNPEPSWWTSTALEKFERTSEKIERK